MSDTVTRVLFKLDTDASYREAVAAWAQMSGLDEVDGPEVLAEADQYGAALRSVVNLADLPLSGDSEEVAFTKGYNWALSIVRRLVDALICPPAVPAESQTLVAAGVPNPAGGGEAGVQPPPADQAGGAE